MCLCCQSSSDGCHAVVFVCVFLCVCVCIWNLEKRAQRSYRLCVCVCVRGYCWREELSAGIYCVCVCVYLFGRWKKEMLSTPHVHNALQLTATHCHTLQLSATHCNSLPHTATLCHTLQLTATRREDKMKEDVLSAHHMSIEQHQLIATHCNTLQLTATHRNTQGRGDVRRCPLSTDMSRSN